MKIGESSEMSVNQISVKEVPVIVRPQMVRAHLYQCWLKHIIEND